MADSKERSQLDTKLNCLLYCRGKRGDRTCQNSIPQDLLSITQISDAFPFPDKLTSFPRKQTVGLGMRFSKETVP